jgi:uncharacterized membrane protein YfcA
MTDKSTQAAEATGSIIREMKWTWRRLFVFVVTVIALSVVAWIVHKLDDADGLKNLAQWLIGLIAMLSTYYLIGPTAEHIVAAVQAFRQRRDD